jgi:hypothetical protein
MSGSYGALNQKYNTLYSLYLQLQSDISGGYTLQEVLDAGNTATDKTIQLLSDNGIESNYSSTSLNFADFSNNAITILNGDALTSFNATTGRTFALNSESLIMGGVAGANYTTMSAGNLNMTAVDGSYVALSPFMLNFNGSQGSENQVLTKDPINNSPIWADLPVSEIPDLSGVLNAGAIASKSIDMNGFDISGVSTIIADPLGSDLSGQFTFNIPPHVPNPLLGNDAAPKGYVDSLVGQYAGGFNLFFNYSQPYPYPSFQKLSQVISTSLGEIVPTTLSNGNNLIAKFMSNSLGIDTIPVGLWDAFVYGAIDNISQDVHYYFELWKKPSTDVDELLGTSGISPDVNASPNNNPTSYSMILTIPTAIPLELTDRLYIIIYASYNGSGTKELSTYFEGNYYSFVQTSLNAGTTLLSSNNTWTGTNNFSINPTTPNVISPSPTDIINYGQITDLIEPVVTIINYYISQTNPLFQYPPQPPSSTIINTYGYYGWQFQNASLLQKISWYFAPDGLNMEVQDVLGLYMNYFNVASTSDDDCPYITIYTQALGVGDIIPGFAHSSMTYIPNFSPAVNTAYSSFMNISGVQPTPFAYGHVQVGMIQSPINNPRGTYTPTMKVLAIAVGTNSASAVNSTNFVMSKVGVCVAGLNNESVLNPFDSSQVGSFIGTATSNLNMSSFSIDASANNLSIGTLTSTALTLGKSGNTTNIQGNLQIAGQAGTSGQVLTSNGDGSVPTWTTSINGWVGTATSDLNMSNYIITATSSLNLGEPSKSVVINGAVNTPNALNYGSGSNIVVAYGGETNDVYDTTTTNNIQTRITNSGGIIEQVYNAIISPSASGTGNLILPLVKTRHSVYIINGSSYNWTIASQTGEFIIGGLAGAGIPSTSSVTIKPSQTLGFVQVDGGILGKFNIFMSEVLQGTSPSFSGATCPTIDTSSTLSLGTSTATGVNLGRTGQTTDLLGNVRVNSSSGSSGQVLTSTGASTAPIWSSPTSGWNGTAASRLDMGIYDISGAVLDNSGGLVTIGANTTGLTLGKTAITTNIKGNLQINSASGSSGQVLTSAGSGSAPTWTTPSAGSASLAVVKTNPVLLTQAYGPGASRFVFQNNFLNVTPPSLTATYLIQCQLLCNNQTANTAFFGNLGYQVGGGAQTTAAISLFNNLAMSNAANTTFNQVNSLSQCNLSVDNTYNQLSFTYIHTPATLSQVSYAFWLGTLTGNGAATVFSMSVIRIIA